ncbi:M12 family metallo-peptidase [Methylorubrum podarium]|uniref:M12 family metallo-peptidase n=1 Tax=Methylorubrum podarium TaxID=200476 RepID=A0ABV1QTZ6_9HYPH
MGTDVFIEPDTGYDGKIPINDSTIRYRLVHINPSSLNLLHDAHDIENAGLGLSANLFDDIKVNLLLSQKTSARDKTVFYGSVVMAKQSDVTVIVRGERLSATIFTEEQMFRVEPLSKKMHVIKEINLEMESDCEVKNLSEDCESSDGVDSKKISKAIKAIDTTRISGNPHIISILILYTPSVKDSFSSEESLNIYIDDMITESTKYFSECDINAKFTYTAREINRDFPAAADECLEMIKDDPEIARWRLEDKADLVSLLRVSRGSVAYCLGSINHGNPKKGFSVVNLDNSRDVFSFIHEIAHNMGCAHDPEGDHLDCKGADTIARGHIFEVHGKKRKTIMAYGSAKRIPRFSGTDVSWDGVLTGRADRNNSAILRNTVKTVATYFESLYNEV